MAFSSEEIALLDEEHVGDDDDDEFVLLQRQVEAERQARREALSLQNNLHVDVPAIPHGKTHHLFISHSNEPEEAMWAEKLVNDMEREFGLKCLWPKRDFLPGTHIGSEIQKGILTSVKVVTVLSPSSVESIWCKYERDLAFNVAVDSKENPVIPLLFRACEVPDIYKTLNYIDVPAGEDYTFKIRRCFDEDTTDMKLLVPVVKANKQEPQNGNPVSIAGVKNVKNVCRGPAWSFRDLDKHQRYELRQLGSKFAERVFFEAKNLVNNSAFLKYYSVTNMCPQSCCVCCILYVLLFFLVFLLLGFAELAEKKMTDATVLIIVSVIGLAILVPVFMQGFNKWNHRRLKRRVVHYSIENVFDTKVLVNIYGGCMSSPTIRIIYYDVNRCLDHLVTIVAETQNSIEDGFGVEIENLARQKAKLQLLRIMRENYNRLFDIDLMPQSSVHRHSTYMKRKCLCEIAQEQLWKT